MSDEEFQGENEEFQKPENEEPLKNAKRNNVYLIYNDLSIESYKNASQAYRAYNQRPNDIKYVIRGLLCKLEKVELVKISW